MKYLALIFRNKTAVPTPAMFSEYQSLASDLTKSGQMLGGGPLQPGDSSWTVTRQGDLVVRDSAAIDETIRALVGFFVLECESDGEAEALAGRIPDSVHGLVEVRPLLEH